VSLAREATMQRHAERDRRWNHWPGRTAPEERVLGRLRSLFTPTDTGAAFTELIALRGRELEERSVQLRAAVGDLERRRERIRQLQARVEQILRDGAAELDVRQAELDARAAELDRREAAAVAAERLVESRKRELGAVELHRAALGRREDAVRRRELELERRAGELAALARRLDEVGGVLAATSSRRALRDDEHVAITTDGRYRSSCAPAVRRNRERPSSSRTGHTSACA
jgi:DNA repair exonuclease SbcCD ATPase subunit